MISAVLILLITAAFPQQNPIELKFATLAPQSTAQGKALRAIARDLFFQSEKTIKLMVYYGGQMGDETEMIEKIQYKALDGGAFTGLGLGNACSEVRVLELPGLFQNPSEVDHVYSAIEPVLDNYFRKKGYVLICLAETGNAYFFSKQNIKSIADIRASKMWLWKGDRLVEEFMKELRIPARPVNFTEVIPSLQTGLIDGVYCSPAPLAALQWHTEIKYMLDLPISYVTGGFVISLSSWKKLSADQQKIIREVMKKAVIGLTAENRANDRETLLLLQKNGIGINKASGESAVITETGKKLRSTLNGVLFPAELVQQIDTILSQFRKK